MPALRGGFMMDQQNNPNHVPTAEEIARMEAEAARSSSDTPRGGSRQENEYAMIFDLNNNGIICVLSPKPLR